MRCLTPLLYAVAMAWPMASIAQAPPIADMPAVAEPAVPVPPTEDEAMRAYLATLRPRALAEGVRPETFDATLATLSLNPRVIQLDRAQPGGSSGNPAPPPPFAPYRAQHVDAFRITRGRQKLETLAPRLASVEARTGVSGSILLAIWGQETGYGGYTGNFDLPRALGSLAYEGRRRDLFAGEYIATLKLLDRGVPRAQLRGSWAGATGYPQFLPSTYLRLGADGDGDGRIDIWGDEADTLASIARYLADAGWKPGTRWGVPVRVPTELDRATIRPLARSPACPRVFAQHSRWLTIGEWRVLGVEMLGRAPADRELAALIEPDGPGATAYLLTTNYRPILAYNCSNHYALSVALLADAIVE